MNQEAVRAPSSWRQLRIVDIIEETHDTKTFNMVDATTGARPFAYRPGQYVTFRFDDLGPRPIARSYTMSSSPTCEDFIACTIKELPQGRASGWFCQRAKIGDVLRARGPIGRFVFDADVGGVDHLVMAGAGSGVTPFSSIVRTCFGLQPGAGAIPRPRMTLIVSYKTRHDMIHWDLYRNAEAAGLQLLTYVTREPSASLTDWPDRSQVVLGRFSPEALDRVLTPRPAAGMRVMTCGPTAWMQSIREYFLNRSLSEADILSESFES